uniref:SUZ domain-containing protein n=1 Tax=Panagrellus redivivus TaxID=6233 RepID=A0A7E4VQ68_PANRE
MSLSETCNAKSSEDVADDWECAGDEALVASAAVRQKQIEQLESKLAVEMEQLKIEHQPKASASTSTERTRVEVGDGPVRLLRRPRNNADAGKSKEQLDAEAAAEQARMDLEEREAAYQQARERIFGGEEPSSTPTPTSLSASASSNHLTDDPVAQMVAHIQSGASASKQEKPEPRNHLSDVPMKRVDMRRQPGPIPQCRPPLMPGVVIPQMGGPMNGNMPPWPYPGVPPPPMPPYGAPLPYMFGPHQPLLPPQQQQQGTWRSPPAYNMPQNSGPIPLASVKLNPMPIRRPWNQVPPPPPHAMYSQPPPFPPAAPRFQNH